VLNATRYNIDCFFAGFILPPNLYVHSTQSNVHPFYERASIVLNLSRHDQWIEPFGMTALEAMYYRKPVIVPSIGGIAELVDDHVNGFCVDTSDINVVVEKIVLLSTNQSLYIRMSDAAFVKAAGFTQKKFRQSIIQAIHAIMVQNDRRIRSYSVNNDSTGQQVAGEKENNNYRNQRYYSPLARLWKVG
jgi:glycosyltransferase involved in cell wall biosynthesis